MRSHRLSSGKQTFRAPLAWALGVCVALGIGVFAAAAHANTEEKSAPAAEVKHPALMKPELANDKAPDQFRVRFETTQGPIVVEANRSWAPKGVDRLYNLVRIGFYEDVGLFRVLAGFVAQFGINGDPAVSKIWREAKFEDDPRVESNTRGTLTFATAGPNSRTTQLFFNLGDNNRLDARDFAPIAKIVEGEEVLEKLYKTGEGRPRGPGPKQKRLQNVGNIYLEQVFPRVDYIKSAEIID